jgi:uncharacterized protein (DUF362 family)
MSKVSICSVDAEEDIAETLAKSLNHISWKDLIPKDSRVVIKPNLCQIRLDPGAVTHPLLVYELINLLKDRTHEIVVGESDLQQYPCEVALKGTGLDEILDKANVRFTNFSKDEWVKVELDGLFLKSIEMARTLMEADVFISMPVLKTHKLTTITMGMKNQFGCIPRSDRLIYHPHINEVLVDINRLLKPTLLVMDGIVGMEADGPVNGVPIRMNLLLTANNVVSLDATACRIVGIDPSMVEHLRLAEKDGVGPIDEKEIQVYGSSVHTVYKKFQEPSNDIINRSERWIMKYPLLSKLVYRSPLFPAFKWSAWRLRDLTGYSQRYKDQMDNFYMIESTTRARTHS